MQLRGFIFKIQISRLKNLEHQLAPISAGNSRKQKLIFSGTEIKFHPTNWIKLGFVIERSENSAQPILFEEDIMFRCTNKGKNTNQKARIFPIKKLGL